LGLLLFIYFLKGWMTCHPSKKKTIGNVLAVVLDVVARKSCSKPPRVKPIFSYFVQPKTPKKHNENIKNPFLILN
jgi:hypothetical protein